MAKKQKPKKKTEKIVKKASAPSNELFRYPSFFSNKKLHCIAILILSFIFYGNTLFHKYTQDDAIVIYSNMYTTKGIKGIPGILTNDTFYGFFQEKGKANLVEGGRYRPLSLVMFALETQLFAPKKKDQNGKVEKDKDGDTVLDPLEADKVNTIKFVGHFMNVLMFGLTGVLLYLVLLKLLIPYKGERFAYFIAIVTTLLFIAHPIHTEAVSNIKGRDEIMTLLGSLGALYYSLRAFQEKKISLNIVAAIVFFLALLSKENAITFIGVVPLAFYYFTKADKLTIFYQTLPLLIAGIVFVGIRKVILDKNKPAPGTVLTQSKVPIPKDLMNDPFQKLEGNKYVPFTKGERAATVVYTWGKYVQLLCVPHPLTHDYYPRHIGMMTMGDWRVILSLLIFLALIGYSLLGLVRGDPMSFGILYFLMTFSVVSNVVFSIGTNMAERLMFMPSVGFCFVLALLAYRFAVKSSKADPGKLSFNDLKMPLIIAGVIALLFGIKTITRNTAWKDNFTLFTTDIEVSSNSAKLRNAIGGELTTRAGKEKNEQLRTEMLTEAIGHLQVAAQLHPPYKGVYLQLGNAHNYLKKFEESISYYKKALALDSNFKDANNNLGLTYREAGRFYGEQKGDLQKATQYLEKAYKFKNDDYATIRLLGVAYGRQGNAQKALTYFQKGVELFPNNADAVLNLGNAYYHAGNEQKANELRQKAFQMDPSLNK